MPAGGAAPAAAAGAAPVAAAAAVEKKGMLGFDLILLLIDAYIGRKHTAFIQFSKEKKNFSMHVNISKLRVTKLALTVYCLVFVGGL